MSEPTRAPAPGSELDFYRSVVSLSDEWFWEVDASFRFTFCSDKVREVLGYSPEEIIGHSPLDFLLPEKKTGYEISLAEIFHAKGPFRAVETWGITPSGNRILFRSSGIPIFDDGGEFSGFRGASLDITEKRASEETIAGRERFLRTILGTTRDGFWIIDRQGRFVDVNATYCAMTGYTREEILRFDINDIDIEERSFETAARMSRIEKNGSELFETRHRRKDGSIFDTEVSVTYINSDGGRFVCFCRDITGRKRAEAVLRESESIAHSTVNALSAHIAILNDDGMIIAVNQAWRTFAQENQAKITAVCEGMNYLAICDAVCGPDSEDAVAVAEGIRAVLRGEEILFQYEYHCHSPHEKRWFIVRVTRFISEKNSGVVVAHENITERKLSEQLLAESEDRYRSLFRNNHAVMLLIDPDTGKITDANIAASQYYGWDHETILTKRIHEINTLPREKVLKEMKLSREEKRNYFQFQHHRADGTVRDVEVYSGPIPLQGKVQIYSIIHDITDRKRAEEEREVTATLLNLLNTENDLQETLRTISSFLRRWTGCEAIAVRLRDGDDYPYFVTSGFPEQFVEAERFLCVRDLDGELLRDECGNPQYECMCGNVLCGRFDPSKPFFTQKGSFWTNGTTALLAGTTESDRQARTRNRCNGEGYESVALIPLRSGEVTLGLLQFNDTRKDRFTPEFIALLEHLSNNIAIALSQRKAEHGRRESERKYRLLFDATPVGTGIADMAGNIRDVNKTMLELMGYTRESMRSLNVVAVYAHPGERERVMEMLRTEGRVRDKEVDLLRSDGTSFHALINVDKIDMGGETLLLTTVRDITERKQAEEKLRQSYDLLTRLAERVPGVVYQYRLYPDGRSFFPYASPGMQDIYEVTPEEVREDATPVYGRLHPDDYDHVVSKILESARTQEMFYCEFRVLLPRQGLRWRLSNAKPQLMGDGSTLWHGIISDITDRKNAEEERDRLQVILAQSQKMETIGRLAGGVAHDFNNILTVINITAEMSLAGLNPSDPHAIAFSEIQKSGERAASLTRQLLAFSRKQIIEPRIINLNRILLDMDKMLRRLIGEHIELVTVLEEYLWPVKVDPGQIEQVLTNLVVNARDAMSFSGKLTIETANIVLDEDYTRSHPETAPGRYVMFAVTDTGTGMDKETLSRLFEPFFTTKPKGSGTGLGLSTCYGIVKQNNGSIWVYSEPGVGTCFKVYLPAISEGARVSAPDENRDILPRGTETILVVDDEPNIRTIMVRLLQNLGYHVYAAPNGSEALALMEKVQETIHLLITDVIMPLVGGRELADRLSAQYPGLKVLFMSGYTDDAIVHHGVLEEGLMFIQKPFTMNDFIRKVRNILDGKYPGSTGKFNGTAE